jgi:hypothetical protein
MLKQIASSLQSARSSAFNRARPSGSGKTVNRLPEGLTGSVQATQTRPVVIEQPANLKAIIYLLFGKLDLT